MTGYDVLQSPRRYYSTASICFDVTSKRLHAPRSSHSAQCTSDPSRPARAWPFMGCRWGPQRSTCPMETQRKPHTAGISLLFGVSFLLFCQWQLLFSRFTFNLWKRMKGNNFSGGLTRRCGSSFWCQVQKKRNIDDAGICWGAYLLKSRAFGCDPRLHHPTGPESQDNQDWIFYKLFTRWKIVLCWNEETNQNQSIHIKA